MELGEALFSLLFKVRNKINQEVKRLDFGLPLMHLKTLKVISMIEECTGKKLAAAMGRDKAQINRAIKELVIQQLIIKTQNEHDGRSHILSLSEHGSHIIEKFNNVEQQVFKAMAENIAKDDVQAFIQLANVFKNNLR
ncbi:MarR family winged helix-turn-helix transcriptional regulator [Colwellia sp. E2M01]|uniref:MarR family winged helix-turn-helix transcriptional regulator n=1 Tax=Colwellia sp. E2M01 TaxID=2841561 RepID=UPI001C091927|nr:MarR family winged helix-turn-helix transcriptional regulator [Colwellia sp. E2M01]MBU2871412.1 MarR family winged helix-turn-helix transcriptional regulator [Colwellia sp. E2M01]